MDQDLENLTREELISEIKVLREAIREHRDASLHDLCWYQPKLWGLLPEKSVAQIQVPTREQFIKGCEIFRGSLDTQLPDAPRVDIEFEDQPHL
jgi:hypothetical protein